MKTKKALLLLLISISSISVAQCWQSTANGANYTLAIKTDGTLWGWGWNGFGQIGDGTTIDAPTPIQIGTDTDWAHISANGNHNSAIKTNGTLWSWG